MVFKTIFQSLVFCLITCSCYSQTTFTLKYFGVTVHPTGDRTAALQPYKLDKNAHVVANFGAFVGMEKFVYKKYISVKVIQGLFTDCSAGWCSVTHIGGRMLCYEKPKHRIYLGLGPAFMFRDSWTRFGDAYESSGFFNVSDTRTFGTIQYKFLPASLELEYDWVVTPKNQLSVSFTPGIPLACILSVGWKHWFSLYDEKTE